MVSYDLHDIQVHYLTNIYCIENVDPDRCSYFDLLDDVCKTTLSHVSPELVLAITLSCDVLGEIEKMPIDGDCSLMKMFEMNRHSKNIHLYVKLGAMEVTESQPLPPIFPGGPTGYSGISTSSPSGLLEDLEASSSSTHKSDVGSSKSDAEVNIDWSEDDDFLGLSSEDEEWDMKGHVESASDCTSDVELSDNEGEGLVNESNDSLSNYESGDECGTDSSSDENMEGYDREARAKARAYDQTKYGIEYHKPLKGTKIALKQGLLFGDVQKFREVLRDFTVQEGFKLVRDKNEKSRVTCHCTAEGCPWRIHASPLPDKITFKIKTYNNTHTCVRVNTNSEATSTWISKKLGNKLKENPEMTVDVMQSIVHKKFGVESHHMQVYRAKKKAIGEHEGNFKKSYTMLRMYANEIIKSNPGSIVKIECERMSVIENPLFKRIFIAFDALKLRFQNGCRPFIGVDGCHLKGPFGGVLLAAIALDGNNGLFPIAVAVVESECKDSWGFFFEHLHTTVNGDHAKPWTIMSDQQKGIGPAVSEFFPTAVHRRCCRHLFSNFKGKFPGLLLRKYFWKAARSYNQLGFKDAMENVKGLSTDAHQWLENVLVRTWARHAFDEPVKVDHVTNNLTESFNSWLGQLRSKPILTMLEGIRKKFMGRLQMRFQQACIWNNSVTQNIRKKLNKVIEDSRLCTVMFAGGEEFEVIDEVGISHVLDLHKRICVCRAWKISGIPCKHVAAAIAYNRYNIELYCDPSYSKETYLMAHGGMIHPIVDQRMWTRDETDPIQPPYLGRQPGRPRKNRRREHDEPRVGTSQSRRSLTVTCGNCGELGHNGRTCQRAPIRGKGKGKGKAIPSSQGQERTQQRETLQNGRDRGRANYKKGIGRPSTRTGNSQPLGNQWGRGRGQTSSFQPLKNQLGRGWGQTSNSQPLANEIGRGRGQSSISQPSSSQTNQFGRSEVVVVQWDGSFIGK